MMRPGTMLAAMLVMLTAGATAHAKMEMRTFPVLAGAGAHDVYPSPDGAVWFTAQSAGKLGRLDPRTGKSDLIALGPSLPVRYALCGPSLAPRASMADVFGLRGPRWPMCCVCWYPQLPNRCRTGWSRKASYLLARDRWFESASPQRRVRNEPASGRTPVSAHRRR
jgi:hypothetical protein